MNTSKSVSIKIHHTMDLFVCTSCPESYSLHEKIWKCTCGGLLDIKFRSSFPIEKIKTRKPDMWRYREAIPLVYDSSIVSFSEGFTPLIKVDFGGKPVLIKQDQLLPSGSYKDRGASVLISKANELGINKVIGDSSGNAGCAIAAYCALSSMECEIYVPASTAMTKLVQMKLYGASVNKVPGSREDTANKAFQAAEREYYASHSWNPFFLHGTKTVAFEICEQLGWKAPDTVILPVGNGTLVLGVYIGFNELLQGGIIAKIPRIIAVQAQHCAPLYKAFRENASVVSPVVKQNTLAEGIAIAEPVRGRQIIEAVRKTQGDFIAVSEKEIEQALHYCCSKGFYIEPTSAAAVAGIIEYFRTSGRSEQVVSVFTGNGLKNTEKLLALADKGYPV